MINNEVELDKYLIIVSKQMPLTIEKETWLKDNFEYVPYKDQDGDSYMEVETFRAYTALVRLMKEKHHIDIDAHSAWRSIETQKKVYQDLAKTHPKEWLDKYVAWPGESEHHTGLAFDLRFKYTFVPEFLRGKVNSLAGRMGLKKKVFKLIEKEAAQFGLIKRYNESKEEITGIPEEDWHFRYVGIEHAKKMYESNMCLEEYVEQLKLDSIKTKQPVR